MLNFLKKEANLKTTENGALTYASSQNHCLDLFFRAGAMRNTSAADIVNAVTKAYIEDPVKTMKILFFARDVRGGLGERRFFRIAMKHIANFAPKAVNRNIPYFAEYGRYDDLLSLLGTQCENNAIAEIKKQLKEDVESMSNGGQVSLLAKWLPSVNASSADTRNMGRKIAKALGMNEKTYRKTLAKLRKYTDIIENRLRTADYTFDYSKQPSCAMMKYRKAFIRNDNERYMQYLESVTKGEAKMNTSALYPYNIIHNCLNRSISEEEKLSLDTAWNNLPEYGNNDENALAVIDGSGSMYWGMGNIKPAEAALSLGIYFAEHNKGAFANHFITFSEHPQLVEIKGRDIVEKVQFCSSYNEVANTDIEAVFDLILHTAVKNKVKKEDMPQKLYIISDMEFDYCVEDGNNDTVFRTMRKKFTQKGYALPDIVFWNVNSRQQNIPVSMSETGAALVSGYSPSVFDMVISGEISPIIIMDNIINSERYAKIA